MCWRSHRYHTARHLVPPYCVALRSDGRVKTPHLSRQQLCEPMSRTHMENRGLRSGEQMSVHTAAKSAAVTAQKTFPMGRHSRPLSMVRSRLWSEAIASPRTAQWSLYPRHTDAFRRVLVIRSIISLKERSPCAAITAPYLSIISRISLRAICSGCHRSRAM